MNPFPAAETESKIAETESKIAPLSAEQTSRETLSRVQYLWSKLEYGLLAGCTPLWEC